MLGSLKLICLMVMVAVLTGIVELSPSTANAQQPVYPYPAAQRAPQPSTANGGNAGALSSGFSQQAAFQFPGQAQNQIAPTAVSPGLIQPNINQGFGIQPGLTAAQNPVLQAQPGLIQPQFFQPQVGPQ
ncbi:hypothetical protein N9Y42_10270, partial [Mariniblastus sp.]|nr:hypothetical protein [Mariniblastus sp.]